MRRAAAVAVLLALAGVAGPIARPATAEGAATTDSEPPTVDEAVLDAAAGGGTVPVIVTYDDPSAAAELSAVSASFPTIDAVAASVGADELEELADDPRVASIEPDLPVEAADTGRAAVGMPEATAQFGVTGSGVVVAVVDSGVNATHVALDGGKVLTHRSFATNCATPVGDDWDDSTNGHGTHVAGIVAGDGGGGVTGLLPAASILDVKVLCGGNGNTSGISAALTWLLANGAGFGLDAVNLSFSVTGCGGADGTDSVSRLANQLVAAGFVVVAAAGNAPESEACPGTAVPGRVTAPGAARHVIAAGAAADPVNAGGWRVADLSLRGPTPDGRTKPDVVAPGLGITSASGNGTSGGSTLSGTSMATPLVAAIGGAIAQLNSAYRPTGSACGGCPSGVVDSSMVDPAADIIRRTANDWGAAGPDNDSGWGIVDGYRAIARAIGALGGSPPARACTGSSSGFLPAAGSSQSWVVWAQGGVPVSVSTLLGSAAGHSLVLDGAAPAGGTNRALSVSRAAGAGQQLLLTVTSTGGPMAYALEVSGAAYLTQGGALASACTPYPAGRFQPIGPNRALDTRVAGQGPALGSGRVRTLSLQGAGVPVDATAAVLNVTVARPSNSSFVSVYPAGSLRPATSTVNFTRGQVVANAALVGLGGGAIDLYNNFGTADVVIDVYGYFSAAGGSGYVPLGPNRLLDTRVAGQGPALGSGSVRLVDPFPGATPAGATAVVLNVTAVEPTADGFLSVFPAAFTGSSSVNFTSRAIVPNLVTVPLSGAGTVNVRNSFGSTHVVVDLVGYYGSGGVAFHPVVPGRLLDTRNGTGGWSGGVAGFPVTQDVTDLRAVPAAGVTAVAINVTATQATAPTFVTAWATGTPRPGTSNVNVPAGETAANLAVVAAGSFGSVNIGGALGVVHLVGDLTGWFG